MTKRIKKNHISPNRPIGWEVALSDAERALQQAKKEVWNWKIRIKTIRDRIKEKAPWPGTTAEKN